MQLESYVLARKPLSEGSVAQNVLKWGTGGINIDGSRIGETGARNNGNTNGTKDSNSIGYYKPTQKVDYNMGRFPANIIFDEEAAKNFGEQSKYFKIIK
jgi:site-specific DNA-methyltransferase (adenine-specific)